ncbi:Ribonuclease BN [Rhodovastum atsumiense]|nr:YihY/virulence factor BrkB family protein [Rhodovastum atsumiense]CAH2600347.1 Ribonuclease BN [Rhodovastum atsumiense]
MRSPAPEPRDDLAEIVQRGHGLGRGARSPVAIPWRGWRQVLGRTWREIISDRVSLAAAGSAFFATLALFPALSMLISLYGLIFDPATVEPQLEVLRDLLPPAAFALIADRVHTLVSHGRAELGLSLLISTGVALWSATTGTKSLIAALNLAYEEEESRGFLEYQKTSLLITLCMVLGAILGLALLVALPATISFLGLDAHARGLARLGSTAVLVGFVLLALALLYRFGPSRQKARWHWVTPGSMLATALWLVASVLFSLYVVHLASYDATYGPLGAVVGVMMWFWVSAYAVLVGAELNAELELQTAEDTTTGQPRPIGKRGAFVADNVVVDDKS